jgi:hypothetical protein
MGPHNTSVLPVEPLNRYDILPLNMRLVTDTLTPLWPDFSTKL